MERDLAAFAQVCLPPPAMALATDIEYAGLRQGLNTAMYTSRAVRA